MAQESPQRIGRYEIIEELGRGSMGRVYLARDPNIGRRIAVKVLDPLPSLAGAEETELRKRFILEARAAGKVNHPGIVTVFDAGSDEASGSSFIAMEWVDGESLEERLRSGALPTPEVVDLGRQVALALDAAHRADLVHRDVKPGNILLGPEGRARISDFGIAKFVSMSNTAAGRLVGSPFYMSPEQIRDEPVDGRSDLFSLGSVLYQAATGEVPFASDSLAGIAYKILEIDPTPPTSLEGDLEPALGGVITRALQKDPAARFQSGAELAAALGGVGPGAARTRTSLAPAGEPPGGVDPASPAQRRPRQGPPPWWERHRGFILAVVTLAALPFLPLLLSPPEGEVGPEPAPAPSSPSVRPSAVDPEGAPLEREIRPSKSQPAPQRTTRDRFQASPAREPSGAADPAPPLDSAAPRDVVLEPEPYSSEPTRTTASPAVVEIRYRNHLRGCRLTIRVDDVVAWSGEVGADKGFFGRTVGNSVRRRVNVPAGRHVIGIRIEGADGTVDATKRIWADFASGSRSELKVRLVPPRLVRLSWNDGSDD